MSELLSINRETLQSRYSSVLPLTTLTINRFSTDPRNGTLRAHLRWTDRLHQEAASTGIVLNRAADGYVSMNVFNTSIASRWRQFGFVSALMKSHEETVIELSQHIGSVISLTTSESKWKKSRLTPWRLVGIDFDTSDAILKDQTIRTEMNGECRREHYLGIFHTWVIQRYSHFPSREIATLKGMISSCQDPSEVASLKFKGIPIGEELMTSLFMEPRRTGIFPVNDPNYPGKELLYARWERDQRGAEIKRKKILQRSLEELRQKNRKNFEYSLRNFVRFGGKEDIWFLSAIPRILEINSALKEQLEIENGLSNGQKKEGMHLSLNYKSKKFTLSI